MKRISWMTLLFCVRISLATVISYYVGILLSGFILSYRNPIGGLWCAISAIMIVRREKLESYRAGILRIYAVFIGALVSGFVLTFLNFGIWQLLLCVFITAFLSFLLDLKAAYITACLASTIVMIFWVIRPEYKPWVSSAMRILESAIGVFFAIFISHIPPLEKKTSTD